MRAFNAAHGLVWDDKAETPFGCLHYRHTFGSQLAMKGLDLYPMLSARCELRFHVSIESDRDELPGLTRSASPVENRMGAAAALRGWGFGSSSRFLHSCRSTTPPRFFVRLAEVCGAVVIDHYIGGDGSANGSRTLRTALPAAMAAVDPSSVTSAYRDEIVATAQRFFPGRTGVNIDGFAGRFIS